MKTKTLPLEHSRNAAPLRFGLLLIPFAVACFGLLPQAQSQCQQGCLANANTVLGEDALISNTIGSNNTATGYLALRNNTVGYFNTATGDSALFSNTTGVANTAVGSEALSSNTTGNSNTAMGADALALNTTGSNNIGLGMGAGFTLTTGDNNIDIGNTGVAGDAGIIRIGTTGTQTATFIAGIRGVPISGGVGVGVNSTGQLGVRASSARYKEAIQPIDKASEAILALKPVTFRYKKEIDPDRTREFGLVAEDVEKVNPDLVARDDEGKPYTVRYEAVNAMLLNEFLKEHRKVEEQDCKLQDQGTTITELKKQVAALTAGLQKVSAQLQLSKAAPQTVLNDH